ncbi:MAG: hypothetical protein KDC10_10790 [Calditrichaeota bacterium]|nr:hypothetical protein [Candidatus Cloacimonadota bacterium]MCB1047674.1 hypothetical protein [Calditrichota bacterium]MCB9472390.1 hypothetical protein [Candidatus Delongbacteria bacterium]
MISNRMRIEAGLWKMRRLAMPTRRITVELGSLRVGQQAGLPMEAWARLSGDDSLVSRSMQDSPHLALLRQARDTGHSDPRGSEYLAHALRVLERVGHYHDARSEQEVVELARRFAQSTPDTGTSLIESVRVARLIGCKDLYEIIDGHHRVAMALAAGETRGEVLLQGAVPSWWVRKLHRVNMTRRSELYQPIELPEVKGWPVVRVCHDRLKMITEFLDARGLHPHTAIDLGSSYGYFSAGLKNWGIPDVKAVDRDPNALDVGRLCYGLEPSQLLVSRAEDYLADDSTPSAEVVLFLSLLHHYAIGKEPGEVEQIIAGLARKTRTVLFLDTGEEHEAWFRHKLKGWSPEYVSKLVLRAGGFSQAIRLGIDADAPFEKGQNYGRTFWAFLK